MTLMTYTETSIYCAYTGV